MDFTLSLAHFCELHGPTSVLCTQVLPSPCIHCHPLDPSPTSYPVDTSSELPRANTSYFPPLSKSWRAARQQGTAGFAAKDIDRCASCRMTIPDATFYDPSPSVDKNRPPIRTRESIHVCRSDIDHEDYPSSDEEAQNPFPSPSPEFFPTSSQNASCPLSSSAPASSSCHNHSLEYVTAPSPASTSQYATLRTAVIRALSGEVLPRGQISGPLWFGSSDAGYVIAYQFELKDVRARGRRRQYALLALAGHEITRALAAATLLWSCFEQIANNITAAAQAVSRARRRANNPTGTADELMVDGLYVDDDDDSEREREREEELQMQEMMRRPGVNSFLTGRGALGRITGAGALLGERRGGAANAADVKATSIAELVDNEKFYCELHMVFVGILQELGREFGGLQVRSPDEGELIEGIEKLDTREKTQQHSGQDMRLSAGGAKVATANDWGSASQDYPPTPQSMDAPILGQSGMMPNAHHEVTV